MHPFAYVRATDAGDANTLALEPRQRGHRRRHRHAAAHEGRCAPATAPRRHHRAAAGRRSKPARGLAPRRPGAHERRRRPSGGARELSRRGRRRCSPAPRRRCATWPPSAATCCSARAASISATAAAPATNARPGSGCSAIGGENRMHAVLGGSDHCVATHATRPRGGAGRARCRRGRAERERASGACRSSSFICCPVTRRSVRRCWQPGDIIAAIEVPAVAWARRSLYRKVRDRASFEFALASAAVALDIDNGRIRAARIALGGVGTKPWRVRDAEATLVGQPADAAHFEAAATRALAGARPLEQNAFKIALAQRTLVRALHHRFAGSLRHGDDHRQTDRPHGCRAQGHRRRALCRRGAHRQSRLWRHGAEHDRQGTHHRVSIPPPPSARPACCW